MSLIQSDVPPHVMDDELKESKENKPPGESKEGKDKDEEVGSLNVALPLNNMVELSDPAILVVKMPSNPNRYTREELIALKDSPLSKLRPTYLDVAFDNNNGIWDPELWHYNRKSSDAPLENGNRNSESDGHRRRSGDPRERLRKEGDGIVLSPQRRSFNSGCYVPNRDLQRPNRSHSPLGKSDSSHMNHRELPTVVPRRIGSGRILSWEFQEKQEADEFGYRRDNRRDNERDDRFERRSFGRDFDMNRGDKDKDRHTGRNGKFDRRRISTDSKEDEPEWFSGGPLSQNDTIELRGFDDLDKGMGKKKRTAAQKKRSIDRAIARNTEKQVGKDDEGDQKTGHSTPTPPEGVGSDGPPQSPAPDEGGAGDAPLDTKVEPKGLCEQTAIDLDDILKCDSFSGFMTNGVGNNENTSSRFSRWFQRDKSSPPKPTDEESRRSSIQDDHHHLIRNLLSDISEPNVSIPGDSDSYFAPISPAANTGGIIGGSLPPPPSKLLNLMDMLQRGNKPKGPSGMDGNQQMKNVGKLISLEEVEARMLSGGGGGGDVGTIGSNVQPKPQQKPEEIESFRRLLAQVTNNSHGIPQNGPIPHPQQPMSILEMLSHSQQQDEAARIANQMIGAGSNSAHLNDLNYKIQMQRQAQVEMMLSKLVNNRQQLRASPPLADMGIAQSRELLNRPEAQAILQGLKRGDLTPQHLYQQLANPALQPRHRDLLLTILKLQGSGGGIGPSPRVLSPVPPPHPMFQQQQQQQLRVSPLPNAMHQRVPSPRELQVHTQNIMQRALIKKKLEEQQENYRKKQEMQQRGQSPAGGVSPAKNVSSPTPLAFTPTSVLRKMTADKEEGGKDLNKLNEQNKLPQGRAVTGMKSQPQQPPQNQPQPHQQWNSQFQQLKQPAGRPIVKANNNFQQPTPQQEQFFQQQQQQQRLFNQTQQQRKAPGQQYSGGNMPGQYQQFSNQQFNQLTQQQLRAQHQQQHVRPPQQNFGGQSQLNWQQMLHGQNYDNRNNIQVGRPDTHGGDLSPTSNQLARWFSPELLERARKGKVPNLPNPTVAMHAMSLEDIERQAATPAVHN